MTKAKPKCCVAIMATKCVSQESLVHEASDSHKHEFLQAQNFHSFVVMVNALSIQSQFSKILRLAGILVLLNGGVWTNIISQTTKTNFRK